jgi:predicted MFS family arabinose efflux permease
MAIRGSDTVVESGTDAAPVSGFAADNRLALFGRPLRTDVHVVALFVLSLCYSAALFQRLAFQGLAPVLVADLALDFRVLADLGAVFFWTYLLLMLPSGVLVDAFGARRVASVAAAASGVGCLMLAAADSALDVYQARIVISAGGAFAFVCMMRFVLVTFPERRASVGGRAIFIGNLGAIAAGAPLAMLLSVMSWRQIWAGLAVGWLMLVAAIRLLTPPDRSRSAVWTVVRDSAASIRVTLCCPRVWLGAAILAGLAGSHWACANLIGPVVLAASGFDALEVGAAISFLVGGYAIGAVAWGWLGDRMSKEGLIFSACAVAASAWLAIGAMDARSIPLAMLFFLVAGLSAGAFGLVYGAVASFHPAGRSGVVVSAVNCGIPFGAASVQSVAGHLDPSVVILPVLVALTVSLFGALLLWATLPRHGAR